MVLFISTIKFCTEYANIFGDRLMVGQLVLVQSIGVRIPVPEPRKMASPSRAGREVCRFA